MQLLWLRLPLKAARVWPGAGIALGDGHYLTRWPAAALMLGPACWFIGLITGALHSEQTYTFSLLLMIVFGLIGQAGAAIGLWATLGYAIGDLVLNSSPRYRWITGAEWFFEVIVPSLLSYVLLGFLTVLLPMTVLGVRMMVINMRMLPRALVPAMEFVGAAVAAGFGAYVWSQTVPLLIRPVFVWPGGVPDVDAIKPLQETGWLLVFVVAAAAVGRVVLERKALVGKTATFSQILWAGLGAQLAKGPRKGVAGLVMVGVGAAGTTLLLSGIIGSFFEAFIVLMFFGGLLFLRFFLVTVGAPVVGVLTKVPYLVRFGVGLVAGYLVARVVIGFFWGSTTSFLPVLVSACVAVAVMTLLTLPATAPVKKPGV
ncbi:hypothetical protein [Allorhizocola rhizosphaerae]|uniref:hypothetical protein n=1 Tax=Allorhizocola rhizosphaerae TaxID=1872709 RepID=UPI000E3EB2A0|nr:hypothetical protein [Allorhizocola rhizosphaerae]